MQAVSPAPPGPDGWATSPAAMTDRQPARAPGGSAATPSDEQPPAAGAGTDKDTSLGPPPPGPPGSGGRPVSSGDPEEGVPGDNELPEGMGAAELQRVQVARAEVARQIAGVLESGRSPVLSDLILRLANGEIPVEVRSDRPETNSTRVRNEFGAKQLFEAGVAAARRATLQNAALDLGDQVPPPSQVGGLVLGLLALGETVKAIRERVDPRIRPDALRRLVEEATGARNLFQAGAYAQIRGQVVAGSVDELYARLRGEDPAAPLTSGADRELMELRLSGKGQELIQALGQGMTAAEAGAAIGIKGPYLNALIQRTCSGMGVDSLDDVRNRAIQLGMVERLAPGAAPPSASEPPMPLQPQDTVGALVARNARRLQGGSVGTGDDFSRAERTALQLVVDGKSFGEVRDALPVSIDRITTLAGTRNTLHAGVRLAQLAIEAGESIESQGISGPTTTPVEEAIIRLMAEGASAQEVAHELSGGVRTSAVVRLVEHRLGARNLLQAGVHAVARGFTQVRIPPVDLYALFRRRESSLGSREQVRRELDRLVLTPAAVALLRDVQPGDTLRSLAERTDRELRQVSSLWNRYIRELHPRPQGAREEAERRGILDEPAFFEE